MATVSKRQPMPDTYFQLVKRFPLVHIRDDRQLAAAQEMIDELLSIRLDRGSEEYLDALTDLVEAHEDKYESVADVSEADILRELMRANALNQPKLAKLVGMAQSTLSAVLCGARGLTKDQIIALSRHFNVAPAAFLPG